MTPSAGFFYRDYTEVYIVEDPDAAWWRYFVYCTGYGTPWVEAACVTLSGAKRRVERAKEKIRVDRQAWEEYKRNPPEPNIVHKENV